MKYSEDKIKVANEALALIAPIGSHHFFAENGTLYFGWENHRDRKLVRRWQTKPRSDSYPVFGKSLAIGGTVCNAICQLARFIQGRQVLPISAWEHWIRNGLARERNRELWRLLEQHWPKQVDCIFCKEPIAGGFDWFGHGAKAGCGHHACYQKFG